MKNFDINVIVNVMMIMLLRLRFASIIDTSIVEKKYLNVSIGIAIIFGSQNVRMMSIFSTTSSVECTVHFIFLYRYKISL